jgi:CrcB protein
MQLFLAAAAGGALGAGARFLVNVAFAQLLGPAFPWATLTVNVVGSFLMGLVVGFSSLLLGGSAVFRTFLATGILGGFTTFSAFSLDAVELFERRQPALAGVYIAASVAISIAALWAGLTAAKVSIR